MNYLHIVSTKNPLGCTASGEAIHARCAGAKGSGIITWSDQISKSGTYIIRFDSPVTVESSIGKIRIITSFRTIFEDAVAFLVEACGYEEPGS